MVRANVERLMPHTGDWKGDVSVTFDPGHHLRVEIDLPGTMVLDADAAGLLVTPEGLAYVNMEVKKALFKSEQAYQFWRTDQLKGKKGAKRS